MTQVSLPKSGAEFVDQARRPTTQFYRFLAALASAQGGNASADDIAQIEQELNEICRALGSPDGTPQNIPPLADGGYPTLQADAPLKLVGLLQNGFAKLLWQGDTDDVPEGTDNLYFDPALAWMFS